MADETTTTGIIDRLAPGREIGVSAWLTVDQDMITQFGLLTRDPDPMHVDPEWATTKGPFGHTVAFGFLTISLLTTLLHDAARGSWSADPVLAGYNLNYGFDRLRLITPVAVNARIRGRFRTLDISVDEKGRRQVKIGTEIEIEGHDRPALVAEWITVWVPPEQV